MELLGRKIGHRRVTMNARASKKWGLHQLEDRSSLRKEEDRTLLFVRRLVPIVLSVSIHIQLEKVILLLFELKRPIWSLQRLQDSRLSFQQLIVDTETTRNILLSTFLSAAIVPDVQRNDVAGEAIAMELLSDL